MEKASLPENRSRSNAVGFEELRPLWSGFLRSAQRFPQRPVVIAEGKALSYEALYELSSRIAATIQRYPEFSSTPLTGVFAYRSTTAFAGVLGALLTGNGYVPLNRTFPEGRTQVMFERSGCRSVIVDASSLPQLNGLLEHAGERVLVILPDVSDAAALEAKWPMHSFVPADHLWSRTK